MYLALFLFVMVFSVVVDRGFLKTGYQPTLNFSYYPVVWGHYSRNPARQLCFNLASLRGTQGDVLTKGRTPTSRRA